jgi:hypothetical protein
MTTSCVVRCICFLPASRQARLEVHRRHLQTGRRPILRVEKQQRNTVARSSEAVRADDYELRSTVYLRLVCIAARPTGGSSPSPAKRVADPFYGWRDSRVTP